MRSTQKVSVWPVALAGGLRYEAPKVNAAGKVYGWKTVFDPHRPFAIDMAGFAVNLRLILSKPQAYFKLRGVKGGYQESSLLRELVTLNDLEPKAANCTKVNPFQCLLLLSSLFLRIVKMVFEGVKPVVASGANTYIQYSVTSLRYKNIISKMYLKYQKLKCLFCCKMDTDDASVWCVTSILLL